MHTHPSLTTRWESRLGALSASCGRSPPLVAVLQVGGDVDGDGADDAGAGDGFKSWWRR